LPTVIKNPPDMQVVADAATGPSDFPNSGQHQPEVTLAIDREVLPDMTAARER